MNEPIDLRSDTVTRPTRGMLDAMTSAKLGDDVLGDDPTVIELEQKFAQLLSKDDACFLPSGTMANQASIRVLTRPGDEIIAHRDSHVYLYEGGAPAALSGCSFAFADGERGRFDPETLRSLIRPDDPHFPRSRLVVIENTQNRGGGTVWQLDEVRGVVAAARDAGMCCHLDGARLWNASVASGVPMREFAILFDTVSCCFSKGLGCPIGSAVAADRDVIREIRRVRKVLGGAMRQSGILAAAALHAMEHHIDRLAEDHANAARLAHGLAGLPGIDANPARVETNIVYFNVDPSLGTADELCDRMEAAGVRMLSVGPQAVRAVTHLDVGSPMIERALEAISGALSSS